MPAYGLERPYGHVVLNHIDLHRFELELARNAWSEQRPRTPHSARLVKLLGAELLRKLERHGRRERLYDPPPLYVSKAIRRGSRQPTLWRQVEPGHDVMPITILGDTRKE
ncbi:MAG: hypothetical protein F4150_07485 [Chloroflexi bacterium]|nr:hypothetical protein [Chloroflexota bacterium]